MNAYRYKALSRDGKNVRGVINAYDEFEAVAQIKQECDIVLEIKEVAPSKREPININEPLWVSDKILSLTASQFAILLRAGLPTSRTVEIIAGQTSDKLMKRILKQVAEDVAAGYGLAQSLENRGKKIPLTFIETVRAGESSGTLEQSFDRLAKYYDKSHKLQSKVRGAMTYPAILAVLAVIVIIIVVNVCVPVVAGVITSSGGTLPLPTRMLLGAYDFCNKWWPVMLGLLAALLIAFHFYKKTEKGRMKLAKLLLRLPVLGNINRMNVASQFANTMTTLLSAGLPTTQALSITGKVMDNYAAGTSVASSAVGIEEGKRLGDVLKESPYLPELLVEMTGVGEESGSLEETLFTIGSYYDSEVEQATTKALGMLEPAITVIMGLVIGFIVIAMYLPMFTMYSGM